MDADELKQQIEGLSRKEIGDLAAEFYKHPSRDMTVVGVTGTNGKTSCAQFIAYALDQLGTKCGVVGTIGSGFPGALKASRFTTPNATDLQELLADLKTQGAKAISMEVSSHGLHQQRVHGVEFDIAVFTNLTRDHLDYHKSMEEYAATKAELFKWPTLKAAIINVDDEFGKLLVKTIKTKVIRYSLTDENAEVYAEDIKLNTKGFSFFVKTPWGEGRVHCNLLGRFNISNVLATIASLGVYGISFDEMLPVLEKLPTVIGRMQAFGGGKQPLVVVDYAHTPDALEKALQALREHCQGTLWCVFGCGGNRDSGKRPLMAKVAEQYSDQLIITNDNPRYEDPEAIVDDIAKGLLCSWAAEIVYDREAAIAHAIDCAQAGDVVLIAGKGHEPYQQIGDERIPFSDIEQVTTHL